MFLIYYISYGQPTVLYKYHEPKLTFFLPNGILKPSNTEQNILVHTLVVNSVFVCTRCKIPNIFY